MKIFLKSLSFVTLAYFANSCGQPASKTSQKGTASGPTAATQTPAATPPTAGNATANTGGTPCVSAALELVGGVDYASTVQAILAVDCANCHVAGGQPPDLSTYATAMADGTGMVQQIMAGLMPPPGLNMSAADKATVLAWAAGGYLQGAVASGTGSGSGNGSGTTTASASGSTAVSSAPAATNSQDCIATTVATQPAAGSTAASNASGSTAASNASGSTATAGGKGTTTTGMASGSTTTGMTTGTAMATGTTTIKPVTYANGVSNIVNGYCTNCHRPGRQGPDLTTYALAKANAVQSLADMKNGRMPIGVKLTAEVIATFQAWVTGGEQP